MPAPVGELFLLLCGRPQRDAAVERYAFELDVESVPVLVRPGAANSGPERFLAFAVTDLVGNVSRSLRAGVGGGVRV